MMAGSHITELHTHKYKEPAPLELLNKVLNVSQVCDLAQKCQLDPLDKSKDSNMLSKTNNVTHTTDIDLKVPNIPEVCDTVQKCQLDLSDKIKDLNMLSKTNNVTHANVINLLSQENQDYYN